MKRRLSIVAFLLVSILMFGSVASAVNFEFTDGTAGDLKNTLSPQVKADMLAAITAEYNAQKAKGFNPGQLQGDDWGKIHLWDDQGVTGVCIRFEKGDSTAKAYSKEGPWYGIFHDSWLGIFFQNDRLAIIFVVEQNGKYNAYTLKNEAMDAAWCTNGFKDTGAPISNEFVTKEGYVAQNFQKGAILITDMADLKARRTEFVDTYWKKGEYITPPKTAAPPATKPADGTTPADGTKPAETGDMGVIMFMLMGLISLGIAGVIIRKRCIQ